MNLPKLKADLRRISELVNELDPLIDSVIANAPERFEADRYDASNLQARGFDALKEGTEALQEWASMRGDEADAADKF